MSRNIRVLIYKKYSLKVHILCTELKCALPWVVFYVTRYSLWLIFVIYLKGKVNILVFTPLGYQQTYPQNTDQIKNLLFIGLLQ